MMSYDIGNENKNMNQVMRKFASTTKCRRKVILEYFGVSAPDSDVNIACNFAVTTVHQAVSLRNVRKN